MKIYLIILASLFAFTAFGQSKKLPTILCDSVISFTFPSDTLEIKDTSIHFIKIGEHVFEIKRLSYIWIEAIKPPTPYNKQN